MLFGSIFGSTLVIEILKICQLSAELVLPENQFDCGAISLDRNMLLDCVNDIKDMVTRSSSMRSLSELMENNIKWNYTQCSAPFAFAV